MTALPGSDPAVDRFFVGRDEARPIFDALAVAISCIGSAEVRVTRSQVAFWRKHPFAWAWVPGQYLKHAQAPLVLTVALRRRDPSPRWKQIVEPAPGRFTHHLELHAAAEIDDAVRSSLREAWRLAG
jgi:hypothetical protein